MDFERRDEGDAFGFTWEDDKKPNKEALPKNGKKKTEVKVKAIPKKKE
jgi:hypothetical protein